MSKKTHIDSMGSIPKLCEATFETLTISETPKHVNVIQDGRIATSESAAVPIHYADEAGLVEEVSKLIDKGYAFVDTPAGWSPSAILQELQERWILRKDFVAITWSGPGKFRTFVVPYMAQTET